MAKGEHQDDKKDAGKAKKILKIKCRSLGEETVKKDGAKKNAKGEDGKVPAKEKVTQMKIQEYPNTAFKTF